MSTDGRLQQTEKFIYLFCYQKDNYQLFQKLCQLLKFKKKLSKFTEIFFELKIFMHF